MDGCISLTVDAKDWSEVTRLKLDDVSLSAATEMLRMNLECSAEATLRKSCSLMSSSIIS